MVEDKINFGPFADIGEQKMQRIAAQMKRSYGDYGRRMMFSSSHFNISPLIGEVPAKELILCRRSTRISRELPAVIGGLYD